MLPLLAKLIAMFNPFMPVLTQVGPWVASVIPLAFSSVRQYWKLYLIGLLALVVAGTTFGFHHEALALKTEKAAHAADIKSYKDAQAAAQAKVDADRKNLLQQSKDQAHAADKSYSNLLATYRANLLRYEALKGASGGPGSATDGNATQGINGPGAGTVVPEGSISITMDDAGICATNTARLSAAHDWALTLGKDNGKNTKGP